MMTILTNMVNYGHLGQYGRDGHVWMGHVEAGLAVNGRNLVILTMLVNMAILWPRWPILTMLVNMAIMTSDYDKPWHIPIRI